MICEEGTLDGFSDKQGDSTTTTHAPPPGENGLRTHLFGMPMNNDATSSAPRLHLRNRATR
jgi:hypothetical protein